MIDVAFSSADVRPATVAVVVDVLRATSTISRALASGYERVVCVDSIKRARMLRAPDHVLAGESGCLIPDGFDQGNSPAQASECRGEQLVLATTNGTPAIVAAAARAPRVLLASLLNLRATVAALADLPTDVQIVCAGDEGAVALEDVYLAGRLCRQLRGPRTDGAQAAEAVCGAFSTPAQALGASSHARLLRERGLGGDVVDCAHESCLEVVPTVIGTRFGVAVIADRALTAARLELALADERSEQLDRLALRPDG
jgi:2-phosphosulfolactate phosphatase